MLYFKTRADARKFARLNDKYKVVDCADSVNVDGLRWAVKVL